MILLTLLSIILPGAWAILKLVNEG